jgi:sporulation protein YlmC with PRC-barrel domain
MYELWTLESLSQLRGADVYSADGARLGSVQEIYFDDETGDPEWVGLGAGFLGTKRKVVPVEGLRTEGDHLKVPFTRDRVRDEPDYDFEDRISLEAEQALSSYFGLSGEHYHSTRVLRPGEDYRGPHL